MMLRLVTFRSDILRLIRFASDSVFHGLQEKTIEILRTEDRMTLDGKSDNINKHRITSLAAEDWVMWDRNRGNINEHRITVSLATGQ